MLIRLIELERGMRGGTGRLREIYINTQHIISVSEDQQMSESLINEIKQLGLSEGAMFSKVIVQEGNLPKTMTVVGSPTEIYRKIKKRQLLKG